MAKCPVETDTDQPKGARGRAWRRGQSGNPAGRPKGTRCKALDALDRVGDQAANKALKVVIDAALAGDLKAAELLLSRCWPARRGRPLSPLRLPPITGPGDLVIASAAIIAAMSEGRISPEDAQTIGTALEQHRRVVETNDLAARLERLETQIGEEP